MNNIIIFYTILLIIVIYILASTIENFQTTPPAGPTDQITTAVRQLYLADVESIRNLSTAATNLQKSLQLPFSVMNKGSVSKSLQEYEKNQAEAAKLKQQLKQASKLH